MMSTAWSMPTVVGSWRYTGMDATAFPIACNGASPDVSASTATSSVRGTITWPAVGSAKSVAVQHLFFLLLEHTGFRVCRHQHLQFFFRWTSVTARPVQTSKRTMPRPTLFSRLMNGQKAREELGGLHHQQRRGFRALQSNGLWRQLTEGGAAQSSGQRQSPPRRYCDVVSAMPVGRNVTAGCASSAMAGSPIQPRPRLAMVMPSCVAAM